MPDERREPLAESVRRLRLRATPLLAAERPRRRSLADPLARDYPD